jgi:glucose/arabinose dehydrogenase
VRRRAALLWGVVTILVGATVFAFVLLSTGGGHRAAAQNPSGATGIAQNPPSATAVTVSPVVTTTRAAVPAVKLKVVASGLSAPVFATSPPGDTHRLFVVEKTGRIRTIRDGSLLAKPFLDIHTLVSGASEQGLLSMAFDPQYATNGRFYIFYTNTAGNIRVVRYKVGSNPDVANPATRTVLWSVSHSAHSNHNGGQLQFGPDGRLYIGIGDGGSEGDPNLYGQNIHVPYAKIWRLNVNVAGARPQLYAYGLRNPWRFSFDSKNGNLWIGDVGQDRWEEIDFLKAGTRPGTNFGWSYYEARSVYKPQPINRSRLVFPVAFYSHAFGCAVIGGYVYRGSAIPSLQGDYLFSDECSGRVWFKTSPSAPKHILTGISQKVTRVTSFGQDASGELYLMSLNGTLYKLVP